MKTKPKPVTTSTNDLKQAEAALLSTEKRLRKRGDALKKARRIPPALPIFDLLMPGMDGFTLLPCWNVDEHLRGNPCVVYAGTCTGGGRL